MPEEWAADPVRRDKAGLPETIGFATKPEIALDQIRAACAAGIPPGVVLMDGGYGSDTKLRTEITALGLAYVAGIQPHTTVWPQGQGPLPPKAWSGRGRPTSRTRRDPEHQPAQLCATVHNRMPVILDPGDYAHWLGEAPAAADELLALLRPFPAERMQAHEIGPRIGNVKNDDAALIERVAAM